MGATERNEEEERVAPRLLNYVQVITYICVRVCACGYDRRKVERDYSYFVKAIFSLKL